MLWESRACDDAGFFVHDALHDQIGFSSLRATIQRSVDGWPASGSSDFDVESIVMFAEDTQDAGIVQNSMVVSGEPYPIHH